MSLTNQINDALVKVLCFICENPLIFFSEADIHTLVMHELMEISELNPNTLYQTNCTIGLNQTGNPSPLRYKTMRIHQEYGHADIRKARSDIAILPPNEIARITDPTNLKLGDRTHDYIIPDYIFEFGTEKAAKSKIVFEEHLANDIRKVNKSKERGYIIHIQRNLVGSKGLQENKSKYEGYAEVIKNTSNNLPSHIRMVIVLLNIGNANRIIKREGKVKFYDNGTFKGINQDNIRDEFYRVLR